MLPWCYIHDHYCWDLDCGRTVNADNCFATESSGAKELQALKQLVKVTQLLHLNRLHYDSLCDFTVVLAASRRKRSCVQVSLQVERY